MSLLPEDKERLIKYIDFLESELSDFPNFANVDWKKYNEDRNTRRNLERWIENIVNCSIDISKVLLAAEGLRIPSTYKEILKYLGATPYFDESFGKEISQWAGLRNIITHDYLDVSWTSIKKFLQSAEPSYCKLAENIKKQL